MKLSNLLIIGGAIILSGVIYVLSTNKAELKTLQNAKNSSQNMNHTVSPIALSDSNKRKEDIQETLLSLRHEVDLLRKDFSMLKSDRQFANLSARQMAMDEVKPKLSKEELIAQQEQIKQDEKERVKKQNDEFETEFQQQAINTGWSGKTEQLIKDALIDSSFSQGDIVNLECRSSRCRVELSTGDTKQEQSNLMAFPSKIVAELPNINLNKTNGRTTIIYLSQNDVPPPIQKIGLLTELQ